MPSKLNKFILTSHISFSVGWFGAVAVFLALAITGANSGSEQVSRSAYLAMELSTWYIIIPFCLLSLITGISAALTSNWGLFRHYWVVVKLVLTGVITILLLVHLQPIRYLAGLSSASALLNNESGLRMQLIADSGAALLVLLAIVAISVYKPWGKIKSGSQNRNTRDTAVYKKSWKIYLIIGLILLLAFVLIKHLSGGGMQHH